MISLMRAIWHSKNRITHDGEKLDPIATVRHITEDLVVLDIPGSHASILPGHGWRPPEGEVVKINTDAAINMTRTRREHEVWHVQPRLCWELGVNPI